MKTSRFYRRDRFPRGLSLFVAAVAFASATAATSPGHACAIAMPTEQGGPVRITGEEALIVWDGTKKEEHFVRKALFDTSVRSFGFLVPTPTRPSLAEASPAIFDALADATKPEVVEKTAWTLVPSLFLAMTLRAAPMAAAVAAVAAAGPETVTVLEEKRVGGMDATVVAATDAEALAKWLGERGFEFRPALRDWLAPYVAAGFTLTAFRYERPDVAGPGGLGVGVAPTAVRLTFKTERPFYPYREPSDAPPSPGRALSLFLLGTERLDGTFGDARGPRAAGEWTSATARFADRAVVAPLAATLPGVTLPERVWLTQHVDRAASRAPEELWFKAGATAPVHPPPIVRTVPKELFLPLDLILPAAAIAWFVRRRRRQAR